MEAVRILSPACASPPGVLGGEPHRGVLGAVPAIPRVPLDQFEEHPAHRPGVAVPEGTASVAVVEDAEVAVRVQLPVGELVPGGEVVVVVGGDGQQTATGRAEGPGGGDHVLDGQGDVLGVQGVVGRGRADPEGDPYAAVGVGDGAGAQQPVGVGDVDTLLGTQAENAAVEEGRLALPAEVRVAGGRGALDLGRQRQALEAFLAASRGGDFEALVAVLHPDVVLRVDSGALVRGAAASKVLRGARAVAEGAFTFRQFAGWARLVLVNGSVGVVTAPEGRPLSVTAVTVADGRITEMYILADPERLDRLDLTPGKD